MRVPRAANRTRTGTFQVFSAILWFQNPITDAQVLQIAKDGYDDMMVAPATTQAASTASPAARLRAPSVMTALISPTRKMLVLASSMKHVSGDVITSRFSYANPGLRALLNTGMPPQSRQQEHRTAACGEVAALLVWIILFLYSEITIHSSCLD
jgi:hypothetical protein